MNEVFVWKFPDSVSKPDFRFWLDVIDHNLKAVHGFSKPEFVPNLETTCTNRASNDILKSINKDGEKVDPMLLEFEDKSRFLSAYLLGSLNIELHGKPIGIYDRNGFEL